MLPEDRSSALPSPMARAVAFVAILIGGGAGALIGYGIVDVSCDGSCTAEASVGALVGGIAAAAGVAVVSVLVLRAMGEWRTIQSGREPEDD